MIFTIYNAIFERSDADYSSDFTIALAIFAAVTWPFLLVITFISFIIYSLNQDSSRKS